MQVGILGPLTVAADGRPILVAGARLRALITRLAVEAPRAVSADALIEDLWADEPPADRANALQSLVSRTRRKLGSTAVLALGTGYRLAAERDEVDANRFTVLARAGAELVDREPRTAQAKLIQAMALWRGEPLADAKDADYAVRPATRLLETWQDCLANLVECGLALGEPTTVVAQSRQLAAANPLAERFTALYLRVLAAAGRSAEALEAYQQAREYLADHLGTDPSGDLQQLHLQILRGELSAEPGPEPPPVLPSAQQSSDPAGARDNLPAQITSFLGREGELTRLSDLLKTSRLITLIGPGGVGKTRLALQAGQRGRSDAPDGVWFVQLASVTDPDAVPAAFLDALRLRGGPTMDRRESGSRDATERLLAGLADAEALVVVDNCEHLIGAVADLIGQLTARCPKLRIIATSREPLGLLGEALCSVPPLSVPCGVPTVEQARASPAVQLLQERAAAVRADFRVDAMNLTAVLEIVGRLDGLPLAIELAAARLRLIPAAEVASLLSDRFRLLAGGNRAALPRHRTLWAVVDWSWHLLEASESAVAERMSVFAGSWSTAAATAVCADLGLAAAGVRDVLLSLADKSLVDTADGTHFRMLETIREFAVLQSTESGNLQAARQAHADYYEALVHHLAPRLRGSAQLEAMRQLQSEHVDILDTIRFLTDTGELDRAIALTSELLWFWVITDRGPDVVGQLAQLIPRQPSPDQRVLSIEMFLLLVHLSDDLSSGDIGRQKLLAVGLADRIAASGPLTGETAMMETMLNYFAGRTDQAEVLADKLIQTSRNRWIRGATHLMMAAFAENSGEMTSARARLDEAWSTLSDHPDRWARSAIAGLRGRLRAVDGDLAGAIADQETAFAVAMEIGGMDDEMQNRLSLSQLYARTGEFAQAYQHIDLMEQRFRADPHASPTTRERWELAIQMSLAMVHDLAGRRAELPAALARLGDLLTAAGRADGHLTAAGWAVLGASLARSGQLEPAVAAVRVSYPIAVATEDQPLLASVGEAVAEIAVQTGDLAGAAEILGAAARLRGAQEIGNPVVERMLATIRDALGDKQCQHIISSGLAMSKDDAVLRLDPERIEPQPTDVR